MPADPIASVPPSPSETRARWTPGRMAVLGAMGLIGLGVLWIYHFPPTQSGMYPQCVFHRLTGLYCSGCGATRALYFLLHGQWLQALRSHLLLVMALPWIVVFSLRVAWAAWRGSPIPWRLGRLRMWGLGVGMLLLFGVMRNLPFEFCRWLTPQ